MGINIVMGRTVDVLVRLVHTSCLSSEMSQSSGLAIAHNPLDSNNTASSHSFCDSGNEVVGLVMLPHCQLLWGGGAKVVHPSRQRDAPRPCRSSWQLRQADRRHFQHVETSIREATNAFFFPSKRRHSRKWRNPAWWKGRENTQRHSNWIRLGSPLSHLHRRGSDVMLCVALGGLWCAGHPPPSLPIGTPVPLHFEHFR